MLGKIGIFRMSGYSPDYYALDKDNEKIKETGAEFYYIPDDKELSLEAARLKLISYIQTHGRN